AGSGRRLPRDLGIGIMAVTRDAEAAIQVKTPSQRLMLKRPDPQIMEPASDSRASIHLWPFTPELVLLQRGLWPGPRVGIEQRSRFGIWRWRRWFDLPVPVRIDADLRAGRREILRSQVYRAFIASRE